MNILNLPLDMWGTICTAIFAVVYAFFSSRSTRKKIDDASEESERKAEDAAKKAYQDAIEAMQMHLSILRERLVDAEKEIGRLRGIIEAKGSMR